MKSIGALLTALAALGSVNAAAIDKRAGMTLTTAVTSQGFSFPLDQNVQTFYVDKAGYYFFFIRGGGGGFGGLSSGSPIAGGGAVVQGSYVLYPGETYYAVVGQKGGNGVGTPGGVGTPEISAGGGGGGSFVYRSDNTVLVAAGGGGGNNYNNTYVGLNANASEASIGSGLGGTAFPGAGGAGAGFGNQDEKGYTGNGANAGTVQGAKGGQTKASPFPWAGGAVDSRQTGAMGKGGYGGGGGGGKYSGGGGGGFTGGNGGPIPGNLGRPMSPGSGGTSFVRQGQYNNFDTKETQYTNQLNVGLDGQVFILFRPTLGGPYIADSSA